MVLSIPTVPMAAKSEEDHSSSLCPNLSYHALVCLVMFCHSLGKLSIVFVLDSGEHGEDAVWIANISVPSAAREPQQKKNGECAGHPWTVSLREDPWHWGLWESKMYCRLIRDPSSVSSLSLSLPLVGQHLITGQKVAIKILNKGKIKHMEMAEKVRREINILKMCTHPHIIRLYVSRLPSPASVLD
jgi:hypothetical protein